VSAPSKIKAEYVKSRVPAFIKFLEARGAEIHVNTNQYELVRFKANGQVSVIYMRKNGHVTFYNGSQTAWDAFTGNTSWRGSVATKRSGTPALRTLIERDKGLCFYCLNHVDFKDASEEHLLSCTNGGPDILANKVLAHRVCNDKAGHLPLFAKIKLHVNAVLEKAKL
jgi:hypothetical protein